MRYDVAPCRLLIWLAAAAVGWTVVVCTVVYLPQALAGFAVAGVLLWLKGRRVVAVEAGDVSSLTGPLAGPLTGPLTGPLAADGAAPREDVRQLVARSV